MAATQLTTAVSLKRSPQYAKVALIPSAAYTAANTPVISVTLKGCEWYDSFNALLQVDTLGGASNTVDVYFQGLAPDGATWFDIAHMTQKIATGDVMYTYRSAGAWEFPVTDATLDAGVINTVNLPSQMRVKVAMGGTSTITYALDLEFFRRRG